MAKNNKFTWEFDQPIHREDKKEIPGIRPEFKGECLDEQLDRILGDTTVEELLSKLPSKLQCGDKIARLEVRKGIPGSIVWHVRYYTYENPGNLKSWDHPKHSVIYVNAPDLRLALYFMLQEINSKYSGLIIGEDKIPGRSPDYSDLTVKELLDMLPPTLKCGNAETMRLKVMKGYSNKIWYAGYYTYIDPANRDFQQTFVEKVTETDLRTALYLLVEKIRKYIKDEDNG